MAFAGPLVGPEHLRSSLQEHLCLVTALPRRLSATPPGIFLMGRDVCFPPKSLAPCTVPGQQGKERGRKKGEGGCAGRGGWQRRQGTPAN